MPLRATLLALPLALVALQAAAQSQDDPAADPGPRFAGRVFDSPFPVPKGEERPAEARGDLDETETFEQGRAGEDDAGLATEGGGPGDSERALPVVIRPGEDPTTDLDAGGRIKSVPNPDADDGERSDERFVRAPDRTYEHEVETTGAPIVAPDTGLRGGAMLRQLDKMTGGIQTFEIAVGQTLKVERLLVRLDACRSPGDNDTHGTMAYLKIWDSKAEDAPPTFTGWMFAESPALSALDHPRYDLWVISCTTISAEASAGNE